MTAYEERQSQPVTLHGDLVRDLWSQVKAARDEAAHARLVAESRERELNALLKRMRVAGMANHLPTVEEIHGLWSEEGAKTGA